MNVRTTLNLNKELLKLARTEAVRKNQSLSGLIEESLKKTLPREITVTFYNSTSKNLKAAKGTDYKVEMVADKKTASEISSYTNASGKLTI